LEKKHGDSEKWLIVDAIIKFQTKITTIQKHFLKLMQTYVLCWLSCMPVTKDNRKIFHMDGKWTLYQLDENKSSFTKDGRMMKVNKEKQQKVWILITDGSVDIGDQVPA
jgi:hypothetical protein